MRKIKKLMLGGLLAVAWATVGGCAGDAPGAEPVSPADEWKVYLSRSAGEYVTVALRYGNTTSYGTLITAADESTPATWQGDKPQWPESGTVEVITFAPAVTALPVTVDATDGIAYTMDYVTCTPADKPETFALQHLMAQLEVHIKISDDEEHHYEPLDATIDLYTTATVDYPNKCLINPDTKNGAFSLGDFNKEGGEASEENWVNTAQVVIPQTLQKDVPCLTFKAGDKTYTFTPEEDITLIAGKKTKLYLGVAYENDYVTLTKAGVVVGDWAEGGSLGEYETE